MILYKTVRTSSQIAHQNVLGRTLPDFTKAPNLQIFTIPKSLDPK